MTGVGRRRSCSEVVGGGGLRWRPLNQSGTPTASRQNATRTPILRGDGPRGSARGFLARRIDARRLLWRHLAIGPVDWPGLSQYFGGQPGDLCRRAEAQRARVAGVQSAVLSKCRKISHSGRHSSRVAVGSPEVASTGSSVPKQARTPKHAASGSKTLASTGQSTSSADSAAQTRFTYVKARSGLPKTSAQRAVGLQSSRFR